MNDKPVKFKIVARPARATAVKYPVGEIIATAQDLKACVLLDIEKKDHVKAYRTIKRAVDKLRPDLRLRMAGTEEGLKLWVEKEPKK